MNWLNGKKRYIGWIATGVLGFAWSMGYVTDEHAKMIGAIIVGWTGVAYTHAQNKKSK